LLFVFPQELTPGVWHILGGSHNSLAIEQENGIIIVEAPNYPERAEAILDWADMNFPGKPVTHVICTHHHEDHSAGLRAFVAAGVTVVVHEGAQDFFANDVFAAPSTIVPDALENMPVDPLFEVVGVDPLVLDDVLHPVTVSQLPTGHASDMVLTHVASDMNIVFESDLYNPGNGGSTLNPAFAQELLDAIMAGEPTDIIAGGHAGSAPLTELEDFLAP
jgi:glyoxylase-like metal-dependent hydrolase (beta-lactamase superfamily II)